MPLTGFATKVDTIHIPNTDSLLIRSLQDRQQYYDPDGTAAHLGINSALWPFFMAFIWITVAICHLFSRVSLITRS